MDMWFVDDAVLYTQPENADRVLRAFDSAIQKMGATRGEGTDVKSVARIVCPVEDEERWMRSDWSTEYIRKTCEIKAPNAPTEYLGTTIAGQQEAAKPSAVRTRLRGRGALMDDRERSEINESAKGKLLLSLALKSKHSEQ